MCKITYEPETIFLNFLLSENKGARRVRPLGSAPALSYKLKGGAFPGVPLHFTHWQAN